MKNCILWINGTRHTHDKAAAQVVKEGVSTNIHQEISLIKNKQSSNSWWGRIRVKCHNIIELLNQFAFNIENAFENVILKQF